MRLIDYFADPNPERPCLHDGTRGGKVLKKDPRAAGRERKI